LDVVERFGTCWATAFPAALLLLRSVRAGGVDQLLELAAIHEDSAAVRH
jgi:hypothetical protein